MRRFITGSIALVIFSSAFSQEIGKAKLYIFENSKPVSSAKVIIDNKEIETDKYGEVVLSSDKTELNITIIYKDRRFSQKIKIFPKFTSIYYFDIQGNEITVDKDIPYKAVQKTVQNVEKKKGKREKKTDKGRLKLKIVSFENNTPIKEAKVYVKGYPEECVTDEKGECFLTIPAGKISISVIHFKFNSRTIDDIKIHPKKEIEQVVKLTPTSLELPEFVVLAPHIEGSIANVLSEERNVADIVDILGSEQFSKSGDSNASSAVKRATGITVLDEKYVYIRGLGGRYSITLLNNTLLPSPEPTKRVVPLDIFPTGVLKNIVIKKTYTADLPASFAAGAVILNTKDIPEKSFFNLSSSLKFNTQTTFKDGDSYEGGKLDFLGIDDGTRSLPFPEKDRYTRDELESYATKFKNNSNTEKKTLPPGFGFSLAAGSSKKIGDGSFRLGYFGSFMYDNDWKRYDVERNIYSYSSRYGLQLNNGGIYHNTINEIKLAFLAGIGLTYGKNHTLKLTSLLVRTTSNRTQIYDGTDENSNIQKITNLRWQERQLLFNQLKGSHKIPSIKDLEVEWNISISQAKMSIPDERSYTYFLRETTGKYYNPINIPGLNLEHDFTNLEDNSRNIKLDFKLPIKSFLDTDGYLKAGFETMYKERQSQIRRFTFDIKSNPPPELAYEDIDTIFSPENVKKYFRLRNITFYNDKYSGNLNVNAVYSLIDFKPFEKWRFNVGARLEILKEEVISYKQLSPDEIRSNINISSIYPSIAVTYILNKNMQLRSAYSKTMTYPDFLELSNSIYIDPLTSERILGNPDLEASTINNFDIRFEWYLNSLDHYSVALFYKDIQKPIEQTYLPTSNRPFLSFQNAEKATNYGLEFEFRKSFNFLNRMIQFKDIPYISDLGYDNFFISGNLALIKSEITLNSEKSAILTTKKREMQGQSPYVVNLTFGYDNVETGTYFGFLYNTFGKRIRAVGIYGQPDHYEQPFNQLDFVFKKRLKERLSFSFKAKNLLNDDVVVKQGDKITLRYKKGITVSIGVDYKF